MQLYDAPLAFKSPDFEIYSDGGQKAFWEQIIGKSHQHTGLTHPWVSNDQYFEDVVVVSLIHLLLFSNLF